MVAVKGNRQYQITPDAVKTFTHDGYDVYDDNGKVVAYATNKTVPFEKYKAVMEEVEELRKELAAYKKKTKKEK